MKANFFSWYAQAIGSIVGIFVCLYAYAKGNMYVYGNIGPNIDYLSIFGVVSSYLLYPLCIITLFFSFIKIYILNKELHSSNLLNINKILVFTTTVIGFMGSFYFIIPATLILFDYYSHIFTKLREIFINIKNVKIKEKHEANEITCLSTRQEMALDLLRNDSNLEFIHDITGLTNEQILNLQKQLKLSKIDGK